MALRSRRSRREARRQNTCVCGLKVGKLDGRNIGKIRIRHMQDVA
jgi:hypothetical protein